MASSTKAMDPAFQGAGQRVYPFSTAGDLGRYKDFLLKKKKINSGKELTSCYFYFTPSRKLKVT